MGNAIITRAGLPLVVKSVAYHRRPEGYTVYNLVVEDDHTYFVGKANGGLWVHNPRWCPEQLTMEQDFGLTPIQENYEWHHPYPKYLLGEEDQPLVLLPESYHDAIHADLDKVFPRSLGSEYYAKKSGLTNGDPRVWRTLSRIYSKYPLDIDPITGSPFRWK